MTSKTQGRPASFRKEGQKNHKQDSDLLSLGMLDNAIGYHLRIAQDASFQSFAARIGNAGMRPGRFTLLLLISENPDLNQKALSLISGRNKSTTSLLLHDLEKRKLVTRTRTNEDRRATTLKLTRFGEEQLAHMKIAAQQHEARLNAIIGDQKTELLSMLKRISSALNDDVEAQNNVK